MSASGPSCVKTRDRQLVRDTRLLGTRYGVFWRSGIGKGPLKIHRFCVSTQPGPVAALLWTSEPGPKRNWQVSDPLSNRIRSWFVRYPVKTNCRNAVYLVTRSPPANSRCRGQPLRCRRRHLREDFPDIATKIVRELGFNTARLLFAVLKLPQGD
jgi:hypothetical protein